MGVCICKNPEYEPQIVLENYYNAGNKNNMTINFINYQNDNPLFDLINPHKGSINKDINNQNIENENTINNVKIMKESEFLTPENIKTAGVAEEDKSVNLELVSVNKTEDVFKTLRISILSPVLESGKQEKIILTPYHINGIPRKNSKKFYFGRFSEKDKNDYNFPDPSIAKKQFSIYYELGNISFKVESFYLTTCKASTGVLIRIENSLELGKFNVFNCCNSTNFATRVDDNKVIYISVIDGGKKDFVFEPTNKVIRLGRKSGLEIVHKSEAISKIQCW